MLKQPNYLNMKKYIITSLLAAVVATSAELAGTETYKEIVIEIEDPCLFRAQEFQLDAFGMGAFYSEGRPGWGGGLGLNYFFTNYIGIGVEQGLFGREAQAGKGGSYTEWSTLGNVYLRYPICSLNLAPYAMIGGGAFYADGRKGHGVGTVGGGLEYRFTENIGIFSDYRWAYSSETPTSALLGRAGLRFAF